MSFPFPKYVQLYPTTRCNQKCSFCFNASFSKAFDMTYTKSLELLDILSDHGIADLDIMGGEPFLLDWMPDFVATAALRKTTVNISTNGSRPEALHRLRGVDPAKINVGVSLEGSTAETHNRITGSAHFDHAVRSIQTLVSLGLDPIVKTVVNRTTIGDIENIMTLVGDLGIRRYYLIHMDVMAKDPSVLGGSLGYADFVGCRREIRRKSPHIGVYSVHASCFTKEKLPTGTRCAGGVLKLSVMPDGSLYPCNLFHGHEEFRVGNIFETDFASLWEQQSLSFFRTFRENKCRLTGCRNRTACTGGCPAHGYLHYRNLEAPDIRCINAFRQTNR